MEVFAAKDITLWCQSSSLLAQVRTGQNSLSLQESVSDIGIVPTPGLGCFVFPLLNLYVSYLSSKEPAIMGGGDFLTRIKMKK